MMDLAKGRTRIDNTARTTSFSRRAANLPGKGMLSVLREGFKCPRCGHDKAFENSIAIKCTRCTWRKMK